MWLKYGCGMVRLFWGYDCGVMCDFLMIVAVWLLWEYGFSSVVVVGIWLWCIM